MAVRIEERGGSLPSVSAPALVFDDPYRADTFGTQAASSSRRAPSPTTTSLRTARDSSWSTSHKNWRHAFTHPSDLELARRAEATSALSVDDRRLELIGSTPIDGSSSRPALRSRCVHHRSTNPSDTPTRPDPRRGSALDSLPVTTRTSAPSTSTEPELPLTCFRRALGHIQVLDNPRPFDSRHSDRGRCPGRVSRPDTRRAIRPRSQCRQGRSDPIQDTPPNSATVPSGRRARPVPCHLPMRNENAASSPSERSGSFRHRWFLTGRLAPSPQPCLPTQSAAPRHRARHTSYLAWYSSSASQRRARDRGAW